MKELKDKANGVSPIVVNGLLLNLRYLTKHIAFKEEQECRIVEILRSDNNEIQTVIDEKTKSIKKYINYLNIRNHVKKIYFGPEATEIKEFKNILQNKGFLIDCRKSEHPFEQK